MPHKAALQPRIFDRVERDGYTVEKVYFQTLPGFYLGGNLYRPLGRGNRPFPAILNPHGHWKEGRLADNQDGSIPARCINFARQGMIAFSYDMVGFNDTFFVDHGNVSAENFYARHRRFATNQICQLWNVSLMGLQTWNSIRALDFLESLPDVDHKRLACTGESGGGTQTYILGAIDERLAAQAPIVMVSHTMQGGCSCENAPGLRVEYSNMEIAAAAVPRPQILVAATGDWTKTTLTIEGPAIEHIYELFNAADRLRYVRFDFGHNYNRTSREAVYAWFGKWLLKHPDLSPVNEDPYQKEPDAELRVWPDGKLPADALGEEQCVRSLIHEHETQLEAVMPRNKATLEQFRTKMLPAWRHTLLVGAAEPKMEMTWNADLQIKGSRSAMLELNRPDETGHLTAIYFASGPMNEDAKASRSKVAVLAHPNGDSVYCDDSGQPTGLAKKLLDRGCAVVIIKKFSTGVPANEFANFYTTYNRTQVQRNARDLLTVCSEAREVASTKSGRAQVVLCGAGRAGLWSLLASPTAVDAVVADCDQAEVTEDQNLLAPDLFCPGIQNIGAFEGAAIFAAPHPFLVHNAAQDFPIRKLRAVYEVCAATKNLRIERSRLEDEALAEWIMGLK